MTEPKPFYNSNKTSDQLMLVYNAAAQTQEELIHEVYCNVKKPLAWWEVKAFLSDDMNEVSIKRSITNLFKKGTLQKTDELVRGIYGKNTHRYRLT